jgi:DNA-binding NtrC family response regulator/KaiC/GvpD/RAD55 family RecA-like ATPase
MIKPTTGIGELDRLVGGVIAGDNVVFEVDSGAPVDRFAESFMASCEREAMPVVYVSFNVSPQTITSRYAGLMSKERFVLVDCFSSGKGNNDKVFLDFFEKKKQEAGALSIRVDNPSDPAQLEQALIRFESGSGGTSARYVFDSLTGMLDLWGDEEKVVRFFGHFCPRLYDLHTIAYWLLEKEAHTERFLAKVRHITQVVFEMSLSQGVPVLNVRKAANRKCDSIGLPRPFQVSAEGVVLAPDRRGEGEPDLLTRMILSRDSVQLKELRARYKLDSVVGESEAMKRVLSIAATAAHSRASIIITGETGTGKELIANVVHYNSSRSAGPLVKVNCGALPETLLESELFGHVRGAFTGALRDRKGRFELAHHGTIFLDEIGDMSRHLQVKLLRVLQEREFEPVGGSETVTVDVRVVTATSRNLAEEIRQGRFRQDLFFRLNVIPVYLPPLRERKEDIPLLVGHFLEKYNLENGKKASKVSQKVMDLLLAYPWPGNVRELENCIERAVVMTPSDTLLPCLLPAEILEYRKTGAMPGTRPAFPADEIRCAVETACAASGDLAQTRKDLLRAVEASLLKFTGKSKSSERDRAKMLGLSRMTLRKKLRESEG